MMEVQRISLEKATNILKALKADFKIILPDGEERGDLFAFKKKSKESLPRYPRNETRKLYVHLLDKLTPGDVTEVPCDGYDPRVISRDISAYACNVWGAGSVTVSTDRDARKVQVLCLTRPGY